MRGFVGGGEGPWDRLAAEDGVAERAAGGDGEIGARHDALLEDAVEDEGGEDDGGAGGEVEEA